MADDVDVGRLQELETRLATLEAQAGQGTQGSQGGSSMQGGQGGQPDQNALVQAFLQGAMAGQALAQAAAQPQQQQQGAQQQGAQQQGAAPQASIFGICWTPTNYDSVFWCRSRFMCNPQSLSCLC
jgi:hypothetical protein